MRHVGIDVSLNSTGITIIKDNNISLISVYRTENDLKFMKQPHILKMLEIGVTFHSTKKVGKVITIEESTNKKGVVKKTKVLNYSLTETNKIIANLSLCKSVICSLNNRDIVGMEGMSYGSSGSSIIDIGMFTGLLRGKILEVIEDDKFSVYAPSEIKKFATSSGAANKMTMLQSFMKEEDNQLSILVKDNYDLFVNHKGEILKPLDDLIDSFYIAKFLKHKKG